MGNLFKLWSLLAIGLVLLAVPLHAEFIYMTNRDANTVSAYRIAANGTLTLVAGSTLSTGRWPDSVAVDLSGQGVYVANGSDNSVSAYRSGGNGALTPLGSVPAGIAPVSVVVDPFCRGVYVANFGNYLPFDLSGGSVSAYRINMGGSLTSVAGSPFSAGLSPSAVVVDPFGRFVYAANEGTQELATETLSGYQIGHRGVLKPLPNSPFSNGHSPQAAAFDPWGRFLYTANFYDHVLSAYRVAANGALTLVEPTRPIFADDDSYLIVVDPWGRFVYLATGFHRLRSYRIAGDGYLTPLPLPLSPIQLNFQPESMVFDFFGQFLYVGNGSSVSAYRVDGSGALTPLPQSPFLVGFSPSSMAVSPY
jgi:6-phosphogluconolactonase